MKERKERDGGGVAQVRGQGGAIPGGRGLRRLGPPGTLLEAPVDERRSGA